MTGFSRESVEAHLRKAYSWSQLAGNVAVAFGLLAFVVSFPEAFDVIQYPAFVPLVVAFGALVVYVITFIRVSRGLAQGLSTVRLIREEQTSLYLRSLVTMVLMPAFGVQYAHLFWFVAVFSAAQIYSSSFIRPILKRLACLAPVLSLVLHYAYWNLPVAGKALQPVEIGFAALMVGLLFQANAEIGQHTRLAANVSLDDRIVNGFAEQSGLSPREGEILYKVLQGKSTKLIADELFISPGTARNHLSSIFRKTGTHSRMELAARAYVGDA